MFLVHRFFALQFFFILILFNFFFASSFFFVCFLGLFGNAMQHARSSFPDEGLNPYPLPWKRRVLTTGLPGSLSLCPHWKELLIQVRVDLTTSSCSARVVSCFTPGPLHQKSVPGSGVKSGSILVGRGVCCKSRIVGKTTVSFQLPPSRSLLLSLFPQRSGMGSA